jgi:hypothetical protein
MRLTRTKSPACRNLIAHRVGHGEGNPYRKSYTLRIQWGCATFLLSNTSGKYPLSSGERNGMEQFVASTNETPVKEMHSHSPAKNLQDSLLLVYEHVVFWLSPSSAFN